MSKLMRFARMEKYPKTKNNVSKNQEKTWAKQHPAMFSQNPSKINQIGTVKIRRHRRHKSRRMKDGIQNFLGYWEVREGWVGFRVSIANKTSDV